MLARALAQPFHIALGVVPIDTHHRMIRLLRIARLAPAPTFLVLPLALPLAVFVTVATVARIVTGAGNELLELRPGDFVNANRERLGYRYAMSGPLILFRLCVAIYSPHIEAAGRHDLHLGTIGA